LQLNRDHKHDESFHTKNFTDTALLLAFSGKLLPLKEGAILAEALVHEHGDISDVGVSTPPQMNSTSPSIPAPPLKNSHSLRQLIPDIFTARKELFSQLIGCFNMKRRDRGLCLNFLMYFSLKGGYS